MNKSNLVIELSMPILMGALAVSVIFAAGSMGSEGVFPRLIACLLLIGALVTIVQTVYSKTDTVILEKLKVSRAAFVLLMLLVYIPALEKIGYIPSTFFLCAGVIRLLGYRHYLQIIACSAVTVILVFALFRGALMVPLPLVFS